MKAILVIDVPDKYSDRDIYVLHEIYTYEGNRYERIEEYKEGVHKAKPMPEKKEIEKYDTWYEMFRAEAFNDIIDEMLGEDND